MKTALYPNPARDELWLRVNNAESLPLRLTVYDASGSSCQIHVLEPGQEHLASIPIHSLPDGAYYLQMENGKSECMKPFMIAR